MQGLNINPSGPDPQSAKVDLPPGATVPHLSGKMKLEPTGFWTNLKDFLTERSIKLPENGHEAFRVDGLDDSILENFKQLFRPAPKLAGAAGAAMAVEMEPGYKVFFRNLRDLISPPKLPPLKITSKPVAVRSLWSKREKFGPSQIISIVVHGAIAVVLVALSIHVVAPAKPAVRTTSLILDEAPATTKLPPAKTLAGGGGGGGGKLPAQRGQAPKFSMTQITPPLAHVNPNAALQVEPTLLGPPDLNVPNINSDVYGDPLSKFQGTGSLGRGSGGGIGDGQGGGLGPGTGGGYGGGAFRAGTGGVGFASCLYCPNPEYSEDARKAKFQGTVVLEAVVQPDGHATDIKVLKGPGLGLDEKAVDAVKTWRFKPALGPSGSAVAVIMSIEVNFRLL